MRWSFVPERTWRNPHFRRARRIVDRAAIRSGFLLGVVAIGLSQWLGDDGWILLIAFLVILAVIGVGSLVTLVVRVRSRGLLTSEEARTVPPGMRRIARSAQITRLGTFGAVTVLGAWFVVAEVSGGDGQLPLYAFCYLILAQGIVTSLAATMIERVRKKGVRPSPSLANI